MLLHSVREVALQRDIQGQVAANVAVTEGGRAEALARGSDGARTPSVPALRACSSHTTTTTTSLRGRGSPPEGIRVGDGLHALAISAAAAAALPREQDRHSQYGHRRCCHGQRAWQLKTGRGHHGQPSALVNCLATTSGKAESVPAPAERCGQHLHVFSAICGQSRASDIARELADAWYCTHAARTAGAEWQRKLTSAILPRTPPIGRTAVTIRTCRQEVLFVGSSSSCNAGALPRSVHQVPPHKCSKTVHFTTTRHAGTQNTLHVARHADDATGCKA